MNKLHKANFEVLMFDILKGKTWVHEFELERSDRFEHRSWYDHKHYIYPSTEDKNMWYILITPTSDPFHLGRWMDEVMGEISLIPLN